MTIKRASVYPFEGAFKPAWTHWPGRGECCLPQFPNPASNLLQAITRVWPSLAARLWLQVEAVMRKVPAGFVVNHADQGGEMKELLPVWISFSSEIHAHAVY